MRRSIFLIDAGPGAGGGQRVCVEMAVCLQEAGYDVQALVARSGFVEQELRQLGSQSMAVDASERKRGLLARLWRNLVFLWPLWRHRSALRASQLVIVNDPDFFLPAVLLAKLLGLRHLCLYAHLVYSPLQRSVFQILARASSVSMIWCASHFVKTHACAHPALASKTSVLEPACRFECRPPPPLTPDGTFASIGLLHPAKGHDVLLQLALRFPDRRFHVIGPSSPAYGSYAQTLYTQAPANVVFAGYVDDLPRYLDTHRIRGILVASRDNFEAFGLTAVEAVALGCIAVVRSTGGLTEIAQTLGLACADDDPSLVDLVDRCIRQNQGFDRLKDQQARLEASYSRARFGRRLVSLVEGVR